MIEGVDYTLNDVYGHEGKFIVWNVRCPKCNLGPGMRCDCIAIPCGARSKHYSAVNDFFLSLFPHVDDMGMWDLNVWVAFSMLWASSSKSAASDYGEARANALVRNDLRTLRTLHEFMDFRAKHKLKGNDEAKR